MGILERAISEHMNHHHQSSSVNPSHVLTEATRDSPSPDTPAWEHRWQVRLDNQSSAVHVRDGSGRAPARSVVIRGPVLLSVSSVAARVGVRWVL